MSTPPGRLETGMGELLTEQFEGNTMLQAKGDGLGEAADQPGDGRAFFRHGDEEFPWPPIRIEAHRDISFVSPDTELVSHGETLVGQVRPDGGWR